MKHKENWRNYWQATSERAGHQCWPTVIYDNSLQCTPLHVGYLHRPRPMYRPTCSQHRPIQHTLMYRYDVRRTTTTRWYNIRLVPDLTRQLSYRKEDRAMRPIYGYPEKFWSSSLHSTHPATFPEICNGLFFRSILRMCIQNLKFVALPVPEIIGALKKFGQSLDTPRSIFSHIFKGLLFAWTLWIYLPSLKFVALPVPEIIGGTSKIWGVSGFAHAPYSHIFLKGFCSHRPCEYTCQVWSS